MNNILVCLPHIDKDSEIELTKLHFAYHDAQRDRIAHLFLYIRRYSELYSC